MSSSLSSIEDKRSWIEEKIEEMFKNPNKSDLLSLDLEVNLLTCALESYKHETVLKPFPSTFLSDSNNNKNYGKLTAAVQSLPPVPEWRSKIKKFTIDQLSVVYWFLVHKDYSLTYSMDMSQVNFNKSSKLHKNRF